MTDRLRHRGPDEKGFYLSDDGHVGLGHRRLSIVDLSSDASQPMLANSASDGDLVVSFNGEIYNHISLRRELEQSGSQFRTRNSDTEVLLHGYRVWGWLGLLNRLRGVFSILLWDGRRKRVHAARDRLGVKPLYYTEINGSIFFASEIKAFRSLDGFSPRMNGRACHDIMNVLAVPPPETLFQNVFKLAPGEAVELSIHRDPRIYKWWRLPMSPEGSLGRNTNRDKALADVQECLKESVRLRLATEVTTGLMLSGGVDSSLILAMACEAGQPLETFTASFKGDAMDESGHAADIARHFGVSNTVVDVDEAEAFDNLLALTQQMDEPIADWACLPLQALASTVRHHGHKVVLVGEGADELFAGYDGWQPYIFPSSGRMLEWLGGRWSAAALSGLSGMLPDKRFGAVGGADVFSSIMRGEGIFRSGAESMRPSQAARLLKPSVETPSTVRDPFGRSHGKESLAERLEALSSGVTALKHSASRRFEEMRRRDLAFRLPELLLMRVDKVTMASSLEARVPFLDHEVVEMVLGLQTDHIIEKGRTKPFLKSIARNYLPDAVVNRPKVGLGAPMSRWLRGTFGERIRSILDEELADPRTPFHADAVRFLFERHQSRERDYAAYLWPIINIALWRKHWLT